MCFSFVDRLLELSSAVGSIQGIKHITRDDRYLYADESGRFCFIPSMIGETLGQLTAWAVMNQCDFQQRPVAGIVASAELHRPAYVGETLALESWIDVLDDVAVQYHGEVRVDGALVFSLMGALGPMVPMVDYADPIVTRRQFHDLYRPGSWPLPVDLGAQACSQSHGLSPLVLNFDAVLAHEPGIGIKAMKRISRAAPYFPDHFPHQPVLPLTVLLECKRRLAQEFLAQAGFKTNYRIHSFQRVKMSDFVYPGDELLCTMSVKRQDDRELVLTYRSEVAGKRVCTLDMILVAGD